MNNVVFITTHDSLPGFVLAGINQHAVNENELEVILGRMVTDSANGLLVIDERLTAGLGEERLRGIERTWRGVMVVLPSPVPPPADVEDYAARLIRRAIGYHVRIRL